MDGVELEFAEDALEAIADQAIHRGTGARGLRAIMEEVLLPVMYDIPSRDDVAKVVVTKETVLGQCPADHRSAQAVAHRASGQDRLGDPVGPAVDVHRIPAQERHQRQPGLGGELHRQRRRRRHRASTGIPAITAFWVELEGGSPAHQQHGAGQRDTVRFQRPADHLVDGVVPADVLAHRQQRAVAAEQCRGVQSAGGGENLLRERTAPGIAVSVAAATVEGSSPGECRLVSRTASREALPQTPHDEVV